MSTANFWKFNAKNYYILEDTLPGNEGERDYFDWEDLRNYIAESGEYGYEPVEQSYDRLNQATQLCERDGIINPFKTRPNLFDFSMASTIYMRAGYYSGAILDYDISIDGRKLTNYDNVDDLIDSILDETAEIIEYHGCIDGWNIGLFKTHREFIGQWLWKNIHDETDRAESFCKCHAELKGRRVGTFSNGECIYEVEPCIA